MGWTLLHMMSATLPETFDSAFVFKLNVYLNLLYFLVFQHKIVDNSILARNVLLIFYKWLVQIPMMVLQEKTLCNICANYIILSIKDCRK